MITRENFRWRDRNGRDYTLADIDTHYLVNIINYLEKKRIAVEIIDGLWYYVEDGEGELSPRIWDPSPQIDNTIVFLRHELNRRRRNDPWGRE